jgi:hypothetical protein
MILENVEISGLGFILRFFPRILVEGLMETTKTLRLGGLQVEIGTRNLLNMKQGC